jgi:hypothetical protein
MGISRKARSEHFYSGLPQKADIRAYEYTPNVFQLSEPGTFADPLTEVLRNGARALLAKAIEAEVSSLLRCHADKLTDDGRRRLVRHGHLPEREIMTGIGPVAVRCPGVRERGGAGCERIRFCQQFCLPMRVGRRASRC